MILVAGLAMWMLNKEHSEIDLQIRFLIAAGASVLSGGITYIFIALDNKSRK
jgi:hypothetical protein